MSATQFESSFSDETQNLCGRFLSAAQRISEHGRANGIRIIPTHDKNLPNFRKLSTNDQLSAVEKIELNLDIYDSIVAEKQSLVAPNVVAWQACRRLGLLPPADFFSTLGDGDVIQIFSMDNVQRFATLLFFDLCSYSLEDLYSFPWSELWDHGDNLAYVVDVTTQAMTSEEHKTMHCARAPHRVVENFSSFKYELGYSMKYVGSVLDKKTRRKAGFITCESVRLTKELTAVEQSDLLTKYELANETSA